jgi:hypothetical protein
VARIHITYFEAGGGHRSAVRALQEAIERQRRPWEVRPVNLQELFDPLDLFRKALGVRMQDLYNLMLAKGWTLGAVQMAPALRALVRLYHRDQVRLLRDLWEREPPDMVVSVTPHFNRAIFESVGGAAPFVTVLTDIADWPPHFWIERQPQYLVCGSGRAVEQARAMGHPDSRIFRVSGMVLGPRFYDEVEKPREKHPALDPDLPTGLVMFGGQGSSVMYGIAQRLAERPVQLILLCGRNGRLAARLRAMPRRRPMVVEEFTDEVPHFMRMADFFIGKPGPGSISEALAMGLPVIVERNAWTLPQERYNTDWVREKGLGLVVRSFRHIGPAVDELLSPGNYARLRTNAAAVENRAVFEIPGILDTILSSC